MIGMCYWCDQIQYGFRLGLNQYLYSEVQHCLQRHFSGDVRDIHLVGTTLFPSFRYLMVWGVHISCTNFVIFRTTLYARAVMSAETFTARASSEVRLRAF